MFCGTASLVLFLACSYFFWVKIKTFVLIKLYLQKKSVIDNFQFQSRDANKFKATN